MAISKEQRDFIAKVGAIATGDMEKSGILASLTIAQAILESGWGTSALATNANALFGIKAGSRWNGRVFSIATKECYDGVQFTTVDALFRAYDSWEDSIADHSAFLAGNSRYTAVIGELDYKTACTAIHAAGYATDPTYAEKLITIIESYNLAVYDAEGKDDYKMNSKTLLLTKNACYIAGKTIVPQGIMVHSTGANNPNLKRYVGPNDGLLGDNQYNNHWNQANPGGRQVCVHAFTSEAATSSTPYQVRVKIADLNIRKGPGTNHAKTGKCTGIGTFTIVEEQSGQGSTAGWGKLKSGAGWISLDYCSKI